MHGSAHGTRYEIRVNAVLSEAQLAAFPELTAERRDAKTVLVGVLPDQAALFGVLAEIRALGWQLLEVRIAAALPDPANAGGLPRRPLGRDARAPGWCTICVRGVLSETLLGAFGDMRAETRAGETVLAGPLRDPAAVYRMLAAVEALDLELVELWWEPPTLHSEAP